MDLMQYKADVLREFRRLKSLAEGSTSQLSDEQFFESLGVYSNSVAIMMKHMAGNMLSRWRDFLTSDGEKNCRNRDAEFEILNGDTRGSISNQWSEGWRTVLETIGALCNNDFKTTVYIRGEPHTVFQAINRQLTHYSYHTGQIVFAAKNIRGSKWRTLSVARGMSHEYNRNPGKYMDRREV